MLKRILVIIVVIAGTHAAIGNAALNAGTNMLEGRQVAINEALGE